MSPATSSSPTDPKFSSKAKITDAKPKTPASPLAPAPSPPRLVPAISSTDKKSDNISSDLDSSNLLTIVDMETFIQILDLDEDDTHEFSRGMAWAYFSQVDTTFQQMDDALASKDLKKLSDLGHFLKGSSAALGVAKVQASCELIQHYGQLRDQETGKDITSEVALAKIGFLLTRVKVEYRVAEKWLKDWYAENAGGDYEPED